jgi:glyoxylase-like metal-dependent hydrolase (beta-lactamase superfamily II)
MNAGINPSEVTKVLLSHLHKDHAGGAGIEGDGPGGRLSFPNAKYYVQRNELAFAFEKGFPSFITEELRCLQNEERVVCWKAMELLMIIFFMKLLLHIRRITRCFG